MLQAVLALRYLMLVASLGAAVGAILMFWEGTGKLAGALGLVLSQEGNSPNLVPSVLGAMDAFLFGIVLVIFSTAITLGLVFELSPENRQRLPTWMRVEGVGELKYTLVTVVLVYLVVDFATDVAEAVANLSWESLVLPISVLLIATAFYLLGTHADHRGHR